MVAAALQTWNSSGFQRILYGVVTLLMICEECICLFMEQTSYSVSYTPNIRIFIAELRDSVLLFDIVILKLHIPNALLISVTL
jgi:hypothetical protein